MSGCEFVPVLPFFKFIDYKSHTKFVSSVRLILMHHLIPKPVETNVSDVCS